jgi:lipoprotein-anchoring transpeptidase ErfK/SrfK
MGGAATIGQEAVSWGSGQVATTVLRSRRGRVVAIATVAVSLLLLACLGTVTSGTTVGHLALKSAQSLGKAPSGAVLRPPATSTRRTAGTTAAALEVSPANLAVNVAPDALVTVRASSGKLGAVRLVDDRGHQVAGQSGAGDIAGNIWTNSELLRPSAAYTFTIAAIGPDGMATSTKSTFRTLTPAISATYTVSPGGVVGVGMPVMVVFDTAVSGKAAKAEVEKRVTLTTVPSQVGSWGWLDDRQLMWRPKDYWLAGTKVSVRAALHGVQTGDNKWVTTDSGTSFTVGSSMISNVDTRAHTLTVRRDGALIRTFPVSTGRPGPDTETRNGIKVIIERAPVVVMDSATVGIPVGNPNYYKITTNWDLRLTWTGEYIHSAPWSVGAQGNTNVSHGCTNMAPADAQWMFNNSKVGDVVTFTGSSRVFQPTEGIGVWVYDYAGWMARSALS